MTHIAAAPTHGVHLIEIAPLKLDTPEREEEQDALFLQGEAQFSG
jgi:hypothetical protein